MEVIRLVHYTTQEYFGRSRTEWFPDAQTDITDVCLTYMSFDIFAGVAGVAGLKEILKTNPLYHYVVKYWDIHASEALAENGRVL